MLFKHDFSATFRCLLYDFEYFFTFINNGITWESTSKQKVKRYVSTSGVYTQIKPGTRIGQSVSSICVKLGLFMFEFFLHYLQHFSSQSQTIDQIYVNFLHVVPYDVYSILTKRRLSMLNDVETLAVSLFE